MTMLISTLGGPQWFSDDCDDTDADVQDDMDEDDEGDHDDHDGDHDHDDDHDHDVVMWVVQW